MQEIGFAVPEPVPTWSGNTHAFYKGAFEGNFNEVRARVVAHLGKKSLNVPVSVSPKMLQDIRFGENGVASTFMPSSDYIITPE
jgi:hypothetical protein